jgi:hypothetical protein
MLPRHPERSEGLCHPERSEGSAFRSAFAALRVTVIFCIIGCGTSTEPPASGNVAIASKLATVAVAVATAGEGHSFLDNFLPCPRRGVIDYRNSPNGRLATFSGCDAGDGIVIDGSAELRWTSAGADRSRISTIEIVGPLQVSEAGGGATTVNTATISNISFSAASDPFVPPSVERFQYTSARVVVNGESATPNELANPTRIFKPALTIDALGPGTIASLSAVDMKRLAYHGALRLVATLFNETLETQRGDHTHSLPCGTMQVTVDRVRNLPVLNMNWNSCDIGDGLFISGVFTVDWAAFDPNAGVLTMRLVGSATFGGGVPRTTVTQLDWSLSGISSFPANARMAMTVLDGTRQGSFLANLVLDD